MKSREIAGFAVLAVSALTVLSCGVSLILGRTSPRRSPQKVVVSVSPSVVYSTIYSTETVTVTPSAAPSRKATKKAVIVEPEPTKDPVESSYYGSCSTARSAGVAPLYRGDPGYRSGLDRDGDGVACE